MTSSVVTPEMRAYARTYARDLLASELQRQHLIAEQNQRAKQERGIEAWKVESYARQERDARVGERLFGELLRALPQEGTR